MKKPVNVAVVGCGYWGPNLIRNFYSIPHAYVRLVCDLDSKRLSHIKQLYGDIVTTSRFDDVIGNDDVDAVAIATPVNSHFQLALKCLRAGKHVFIEKPMAGNVEQCEQLIEEAEKNKLKIMIGHTFMYSSSVRKIKEILDSNEIGEILYIRSLRLNLGLFQKDINVAWDLAPHDVSIINYLLQQKPVSINCQGKAHMNPNIEDVVHISMEYANGTFVSILNSWIDPNKVREMTIVGSKKMIVYDDTEPLEKIKIFDKRVEAPPYYDTFAEFQFSYHYGDIYIPYIKQTEPLKTLCTHFIDCIETGSKPDSDGRDGMEVVRILEATTESMALGGAKVEL